MYSKETKNKKLQNNLLKTITNSDVCKVSKASIEIMLDRFSNGKKIDFPFSQ